MRSFIIPLVSLLSAFSVSAQSSSTTIEEVTKFMPLEGAPPPPAIVTPKPGKYVGVVTITKVVFSEDLSSKVTLKAYANVKASGELAILPVVPESPMAAADHPEGTLSRGVLQSDGSYLMDGKHRAEVRVYGNTFQLIISNPAPTINPDPVLVIGPAVVGWQPPIDLSQVLSQTLIQYRFTPQVQPRLLRTR